MSSGEGITDEAARAEHDLINQAESEEQKLHGNEDSTRKDPYTSASSGDSAADNMAEGGHHESKLDKIKDKLHIKK
ncbi:uncharacterized protein N7482_005601 [Penicillium canariense]|uniref:Uncharacterized protein n=1 Tax=Penicillium canariense TaxID=189055 RepID=A0A9W9I579_9EURO|nr:uncharacterized protein N7482_005601 [Penicillium canariense]KAJ5166820.1 hypothetical protein N7482_005601 [Penicillium canariense]